MTCPNCHKEVNQNASFCGHCGFKLNPSQSSQGAVVGDGGVSPGLSQPKASRTTHNNGKATAALIFGVLGCAGWLIPVVGVTLGVLAIVFGTMSLKSQRRVFAIIGIVLAVPVIAVSIFFWVRAAQDIIKNRSNPTAGITTLSTSSSSQTITSPCYTTKIPASMTLTQTAGSCTFQAIGETTGETYTVKVLQVTGLTASNLDYSAQSDIGNVVNSIPGGAIGSQEASTFAGSPSYVITLTAPDGSAGDLAYIYDTTPQGNMVIVYHTMRTGKNYDLSAIEKNWSWQ